MGGPNKVVFDFSAVYPIWRLWRLPRNITSQDSHPRLCNCNGYNFYPITRIFFWEGLWKSVTKLYFCLIRHCLIFKLFKLLTIQLNCLYNISNRKNNNQIFLTMTKHKLFHFYRTKIFKKWMNQFTNKKLYSTSHYLVINSDLLHAMRVL